MNFTCSGRITSWRLALFATNNDNLTPLGSIDLQVWGRDESDCVFLKEEVTYFQLTERRDQFEVELMDERFSLNFDSGDFIGFFLYEHGLSPTVDVASSNMTVFEIRDRQSQYCNLSLDPDFVRLSQSPMLDLQINSTCLSFCVCVFVCVCVCVCARVCVCVCGMWANTCVTVHTVRTYTYTHPNSANRLPVIYNCTHFQPTPMKLVLHRPWE